MIIILNTYFTLLIYYILLRQQYEHFNIYIYLQFYNERFSGGVPISLFRVQMLFVLYTNAHELVKYITVKFNVFKYSVLFYFSFSDVHG
jgi:hypothetical protein